MLQSWFLVRSSLSSPPNFIGSWGSNSNTWPNLPPPCLTHPVTSAEFPQMTQIPDQKSTQSTIICHFFGPKILQKTSQISQKKTLLPSALLGSSSPGGRANSVHIAQWSQSAAAVGLRFGMCQVTGYSVEGAGTRSHNDHDIMGL